jgi:[protein-PII] uridylyltransferase
VDRNLTVRVDPKQKNQGLMDGRKLRHDLTALAKATTDPTPLRQAGLTLIREAFQQGRAKVRARVTDEGLPGIEAARMLAAMQDTLIQVIYDFAVKHVYYAQNPTTAERIAIIATGGYGRGQLAPGSDIDLLFVRPFKQTAWGESVIEFILYMLWDLGLKVGHATRSLAECVRLARQDITVRTALLEARFVWGDRKLYEETRRTFWNGIATGNGRDFVEAKLTERDARHARQGRSRYLVEPNIKEGKGGLRDLQTLYWIGKYLYHVENAADLVKHGVFTADEYATFQKAEAFLWNVRVHLHYLLERAEERLSFDIQPALATRLGYGDGGPPRRAVEQFMKAYFLAAKDVGDLTRIFCAALEEQHKKRRPALRHILPGFLRPHGPDDDFFVENGRLTAKAGIFAQDPANILKIFCIADAKEIDIHPGALRTITRSLHLIDDSVRANAQANQAFLDALTSRNDPERALRLMNEAGVLGRFIPPFGHAVGLMQFNMYHHYTVDEHLIRTIGHIAALERGDSREDLPLITDVARRIRNRTVLYCAALLHDIAKGMGGNHSDMGADIARKLCPRMGLSEADTTAIAWLVQYHLVMSDTAQRRDQSDPKTVRDFVDLVQSPEMLRLLLVLTVADIRAAGPGVWNGWKAQLLRELYLAAEGMMTGGDQAPTRNMRVSMARHALAEKLADVTPEVRAHALSRHYDNYWLAFAPDELEAHARMMARADGENRLLTVAAVPSTQRAVTDITVYAPDNAGLFSQLAGAIAMEGGSIVDAKAFTTTDGFALDVFSVQNEDGEALREDSHIARIRRTIEATLRGEVWPRRHLSGRAPHGRASAFRITPKMQFDNKASRIATVIEVDCLDRPGLLYDLTQALFESGLSISTAMVATYGERAVDAFYVRDGFGHKVVQPARLQAIERHLMAVLEASPILVAAH